MNSIHQRSLETSLMANKKRNRNPKASNNKRIAREQRFIDGAAQRKAIRHRKEQDAFDVETDRLLKYYQDREK